MATWSEGGWQGGARRAWLLLGAFCLATTALWAVFVSWPLWYRQWAALAMWSMVGVMGLVSMRRVTRQRMDA